MNNLDLSNYVLNNVTLITRSTDEQETTLQISRDEQTCHMYVADTLMLTKVKKLIAKAPQNYKVTRVDKTPEGEVTGIAIDFPKKLLSMRPESVHREYTEEQRIERSERMKKTRAAQIANKAL